VIKFGRVRFAVKKLVLDPIKLEEMKDGNDENEFNSVPTKNNNVNDQT
jgi:hypothetical protein